MNINNVCLISIIALIIYTVAINCKDSFNNNIEQYSPIISRCPNYLKDENTCLFPFTNNKKYNTCNKEVAVYQYADRMIMTADEYLIMIKKLLNDLSKKNINVANITNDKLKEIYYNGDRAYITDFLNREINKLIQSNDYLQHNGSWKYEYFNTSDPNIWYYKIDNYDKKIKNAPNTFNLFKIIYTLYNPLRSASTSCLVFITEISNKLDIQYTTFVNDNDNNKIQDNLKEIPPEALEFSFLDTLAQEDFDKNAIPTDKSGLNYINETKGLSIKIEPDIPPEFKFPNKKSEILPPLRGTGWPYPKNEVDLWNPRTKF